MKLALKGVLLQLLPNKILTVLKKIHYARVLRSITEDFEPDLKIIKHLVRAGDQVVDIGANFGVYTKFLSEWVGRRGRVYSIEPIPLTFEVLCSNLVKLGLTNVKPINCAISDTPGSVIMQIPLYEYGGENYYEASIVQNNKANSLRRVRVESTTVDFLFAEAPQRISFFKCDVEGHELACVRGAKKTLGTSQAAWLVEITSNPDDPASAAFETFQIFKNAGYAAFWFDEAGLRSWKPGDRSTNYFFLASRHVRSLREQNLLA